VYRSPETVRSRNRTGGQHLSPWHEMAGDTQTRDRQPGASINQPEAADLVVATRSKETHVPVTAAVW